MSIFDLAGVKKPTTEGYLWVNILVKFNTDGNTEIVRSYTQPAKESYIKKNVKQKKDAQPKLKFKDTEDSKTLI